MEVKYFRLARLKVTVYALAYVITINESASQFLNDDGTDLWNLVTGPIRSSDKLLKVFLCRYRTTIMLVPIYCPMEVFLLDSYLFLWHPISRTVRYVHILLIRFLTFFIFA